VSDVAVVSCILKRDWIGPVSVTRDIPHCRPTHSCQLTSVTAMVGVAVSKMAQSSWQWRNWRWREMWRSIQHNNSTPLLRMRFSWTSLLGNEGQICFGEYLKIV